MVAQTRGVAFTGYFSTKLGGNDVYVETENNARIVAQRECGRQVLND